MEINKKSLKEYNKLIAKRKNNINLEKLFENDNYLVQTLKRTKRVLLENPAEASEIKLNSALKTIYKNITLLGDPEIKEYNSENNAFKKNYANFLKKSETSNAKSFQDIIDHYLNTGYKIPNLDFKHNLFKVNPLIEENMTKISNYFLTQYNKKLTQKDIIVLKSMLYLNKLNNMINFKYNKKKRTSITNIHNQIRMEIKEKEEKDEIIKLKKYAKDIQNLIKLISNEKNLKFNYRNSYHDLYSSFKKLHSFKKLNSLPKKINLRMPSPKINISNNNIDSERSNENESIKNLRDIIEKEEIKNFDKDNNITQKTLKNNLMNTNINKRKTIFIDRNSPFNFNNKAKMSNFPFGLKTETNLNYIKKNKFKNNNKNTLPLFERTQVKEKKSNKYFSLMTKRTADSRNKTENLNSNSNFANKTEFYDFAYRRLKRGNFENINNLIENYLYDIEGKNEKEVNSILNKYNYKNFKVNLKEIEINIKKNEIDKKTEKIYLNNFVPKKVSKRLETMRKKEEQISRLNNIASTIGNHT